MGITSLKDKIIHSFFEVTVLTKGISGVLEILISVLFFFSKTETIYNAILYFAHRNVVKSHRFAEHYLNRQASNFSIHTQHFIAFYFLFYGLVNIFLVVFLLKEKLWAYPIAMAFYTIFIAYQVYRSFLHHSGLLLALAIFDIFLVVLTLLEYQRLEKEIL